MNTIETTPTAANEATRKTNYMGVEFYVILPNCATGHTDIGHLNRV